MSPRRLIVAAASALALILGPALAPVAPAAAQASPASVARAATAYLLSAENADGGFGPAPGQPSGQMFSGWAALGLAAAGVDLNRVAHGGPGLVHYVEAAPGDAGSLERTILVARAAGLSPRSFGGRDLVAALRRHIARDGSVSHQVNLTAFAVLALRAAHLAPSARTLGWLVAQQDHDGGFSFATGGAASDVDDTGAALEALAGDAAAAAARARAIAYLRGQQDRDGGFPSQAGAGSNAQSTSWAIQGLIAAGVSPQTVHRSGSPSPVDYLARLATAGGSIRYSAGIEQTPVWVTGEALMALEGKPLPVAAPPPGPLPAPAAAPPRRAGHRSGSAGRPAPARARARQSATAGAAAPAAPAAPSAGSAPAGTAPARAANHGSAGRHGRAASEAAGAAAGQALADRLVTALGAVTALALAPVGAG